MFVYADNAATTRVLPKVLEAMLPYFTEQYGNPSSTYPLGQEASRALIASRETIARLLGCRPREITFTSGGSESDNQALRTAAAWGKAHGRTRLIASAIEHHAILHTLEALQAEGYSVTLLPANREGQVEPAALEQALTPETALVSVMTANNETGAIQPIEKLAALAHAQGALFHTDAVQALGHIPVTLKNGDIDFLSGSAHKFHGPKGIGFLFTKQGIDLKNLIFGGEQERGNGQERKTYRASWAWLLPWKKRPGIWMPMLKKWPPPGTLWNSGSWLSPAPGSTAGRCPGSPAT